MASSTPTAVRSATPTTRALTPDRNVAKPKMTPLSFFTAWPSGNSEARMSSSVTAGPPDLVGQRDELVGRQIGDGFRMRDSFRRPDVDGVLAGAEAPQPFRKTLLLGLQLGEAKRSDQTKQLQRG